MEEGHALTSSRYGGSEWPNLEAWAHLGEAPLRIHLVKGEAALPGVRPGQLLIS